MANLLGLAALCAVALAILSPQIVEAMSEHTHPDALTVADVAGFTKIGFSEDYLVIVNVLPGEPMYTNDEYVAERPLVGELIIAGGPTALTTNSRHVEAHVYDRATGLPVTDPEPVIQIIDNTSGSAAVLASILMHDVIVGETDIHFGNNAVLNGAIDLTVKVTIAGQEVVIDGYLN